MKNDKFDKIEFIDYALKLLCGFVEKELTQGTNPEDLYLTNKFYSYLIFERLKLFNEKEDEMNNKLKILNRRTQL